MWPAGGAAWPSASSLPTKSDHVWGAWLAASCPFIENMRPARKPGTPFPRLAWRLPSFFSLMAGVWGISISTIRLTTRLARVRWRAAQGGLHLLLTAFRGHLNGVQRAIWGAFVQLPAVSGASAGRPSSFPSGCPRWASLAVVTDRLNTDGLEG